MRIARAASITTGEAISRWTLRRGSLLAFDSNGACTALAGTRCMLHNGRPLACRLYPLGIERGDDGMERFIQLEPASGSTGVYGTDSTIDKFLMSQEVDKFLAMSALYRPLIELMHDRIVAMVDFETTEPREFWRCAVREALAESNYDANPIIDAMFDADSIRSRGCSDYDGVVAHVGALRDRIQRERKPEILAAAAVMLSVSLGYSPAEARLTIGSG